MNSKLYQRIASLVQAVENCRKADNHEWLQRHGTVLRKLVDEHMPRGSGIDSGSAYDSCSKPNRLVFNTAYHHMHESGMYDGWTDHSVTVTPDLASGFNLHISGRNRNDIKEYLHEVFHTALNTDIDDATYAILCLKAE